MKRYVTRSTVWSVTFYALTIFAVCCLKSKDQIKGNESFLIFIPLLLLGVSSESFSKLFSRRLRILGATDFCCKALAFILLVLPFSVSFLRKLFILRLVSVCVLFVISVAIEIVSVKLYDKLKDEILNNRQTDAADKMSLAELGRLNVFSGLGTFCSMLGAFLVLFFGYTPAFFILGIPLLAVGIGSMAYRTVILIKKGKAFACLAKIIVDDLLIAALIALSFVFTTAEISDTESGFIITHSGSVHGTVGFLILYVGTLAVLSHTNRKTAVAYLKRRNKLQNDELF